MKAKNALLETYLEGCTLRQLAEQASLALQNPVLICDSNFNILTSSSLCNEMDESWCQGVKRGHWTYDFVATIQNLPFEKKEGMEYLMVDFLSATDRLLFKLKMKQADIGYLMVLGQTQPLFHLPLEDYRFVTKVVAKQLSQNDGLYLHLLDQKSAERFLVSLLHDEIPNPELKKIKLVETGLVKPGQFLVFCVDLKTFKMNRDRSLEAFRYRTQQIFSNIWLIYTEQTIVILTDATALCKRKPGWEQSQFTDFAQLLHEYGLQGGVSQIFQDIYLFKYYYQQASKSISIAGHLKIEDDLVYYDDISVFQMAFECSKKHEFLYFCHSDVLTTYRWDQKTRGEYLLTLFYYLDTCCNTGQTAKVMKVHRNTVTYRIERLKEQFDLNFDCGRNRYSYWFSCILIFYAEGTLASVLQAR